MDRDMVNCLHYLYQWGQITIDQLNEYNPGKRLFWCGPDTRHPLKNQNIVNEEPNGDLKLERSVYNFIDMIESQIRSMPKPDYTFGYPISAAIRAQGKKRPAFLAISYSQKFDSIKKTVKEAADNAGFDCEVTGDLSNPGVIMDHVWQGIRGSDAVVADISGLNPNVFYEIGLAHALGKEVIIISSDKETPFDIRSSRHFIYDPINTESLRIELEDAFQAISARYPFEGNEPRF